jgi:hypothetical protein
MDPFFLTEISWLKEVKEQLCNLSLICLLYDKNWTYKRGKIPADNRVALTPPQCKWIHKNAPQIKVLWRNHRPTDALPIKNTR